MAFYNLVSKARNVLSTGNCESYALRTKCCATFKRNFHVRQHVAKYHQLPNNILFALFNRLCRGADKPYWIYWNNMKFERENIYFKLIRLLPKAVEDSIYINPNQQAPHFLYTPPLDSVKLRKIWDQINCRKKKVFFDNTSNIR